MTINCLENAYLRTKVRQYHFRHTRLNFCLWKMLLTIIAEISLFSVVQIDYYCGYYSLLIYGQNEVELHYQRYIHFPKGKLLPSPIFKQPTPGRESPKPIGPIMADDRPQGRCGNRKAKRQQERSSQQQQHEALQPTASATDAPPPDLPLQPTLTVATPAKLEPPSPMVVPGTNRKASMQKSISFYICIRFFLHDFIHIFIRFCQRIIR